MRFLAALIISVAIFDTEVANDNFDRTSTCAVTNDLGANWTEMTVTGENYFCISSNLAWVQGNPSLFYRSAGTYSDDQYAQATFTEAGTFSIGLGLCVRCSGSDGTGTGYYFIAAVGTDAVTITERVNGSNSTEATCNSVTSADNDVWKMSIVGADITVYKNDISVCTGNDSTITTGRPGIAGVGALDAHMNNWSGGDVGSAPTFPSAIIPNSFRCCGVK